MNKDVRNVEKTVLLVEENPAKYPHIDAVGEFRSVHCVEGVKVTSFFYQQQFGGKDERWL